MKYRAIRQDRAKTILEKLRSGGELEPEDYEVRGEGKDFPMSTIAEVVKKINKVRAKYPEKLAHKDPKGGKFEGEACSILHGELELEPGIASDYDFWTWLALENRDLVEWRHGNQGKPAKEANYGIGDPRENLFYRMWLRADIGKEEADGDSYALARPGGNDFWRSHILRVDYGKCRPVAHAFLKAQFPKGKEKPNWNTDAVRDISKRVTRLHPTILFESVNEKSASTLIAREAALSKVANTK